MVPKTRSGIGIRTEKKTTRVFNEAAPDDKHMAAKQTNNWATVALKAGVS